jgi:hypothetical protein
VARNPLGGEAVAQVERIESKELRFSYTARKCKFARTAVVAAADVVCATTPRDIGWSVGTVTRLRFGSITGLPLISIEHSATVAIRTEIRSI